MLTTIFEFLKNWLFGESVPEALLPVQNELTIIATVFLAALVIFTAWWVVKTLFLAIYNMWR